MSAASDVAAQAALEPLHEPWTLAFAYTRTTGATLGRFFAGLAAQRIWGRRATDGRVFVPPLEYDPQTSEPLGDWVEVAQTGTVESHTWIAQPLPSHPRQVPFAYAMIRLDGAHTAMTHVLDAAAPEQVFTGLRVRARWAEQTHGSILDLAGFVPLSGESADRPVEAHGFAGEHDSDAHAPPLLSTTFRYPMVLHYDVRAGLALSAHLRGLTQGKFVAKRCTRCARVYIPPLGACTICSIAVEEDLELPDTGIVTTFCIVNLAVRGQEHLERPFACANVLLDGSDTPFLALLQECKPHEVRSGMRVKAVWKEAAQRGPSLASVRHFVPTHEPDVELSVHIARRKESHRA
jgi:uncharacterized OB-fold protein